MPLSMYDASVTVFLHNLNQLSHLLDKGLAHASATGIDPATLVGARLAEDMLPLSAQINIASDTAKLAAARLTGIAAPKYEDNETTFAELKARIAKTREWLQGLTRESFAASEERPVSFKAGPTELNFTGQGYLLHFALPNFFFHVTTAYDILRHNGVPIGKRDYLGRA
ncbi:MULTISPECIES: DUF1993 family protein [unclassified Variovorax]|uniref:DUF1993 domain-containing protein n=1 Tax=unclassified Variovorax TaxID=663243 RepID=UPI001BD68766|nr:MULTISPECIES: DUF1993 domain-containing protein [unclassified Variovorax]